MWTIGRKVRVILDPILCLQIQLTPALVRGSATKDLVYLDSEIEYAPMREHYTYAIIPSTPLLKDEGSLASTTNIGDVDSPKTAPLHVFQYAFTIFDQPQVLFRA